MVLEGFFNAIFGVVTNNLSPRMSVIVISFLLTACITLVYKFFTDQKLLKATKDEIKKLQEEMKTFKNDAAKSLEISKEVMQKNMIVMKSTLKPTIFTFLPIILIFSWLNATFKNQGNLINIFGMKFGWLGTYIIFSIIFSIILRKLLKVH